MGGCCPGRQRAATGVGKGLQCSGGNNSTPGLCVVERGEVPVDRGEEKVSTDGGPAPFLLFISSQLIKSIPNKVTF